MWKNVECECPVCCTGALANQETGMCDECEQLSEQLREMM